MRRQSATGLMLLAVLLCAACQAPDMNPGRVTSISAAAHAGLFRQVTPKIRMHLFAPGCPGKDAT